MPRDLIQEALRHVHYRYPEVTQVFYGLDGRWLYCGEAFETPNFGIDGAPVDVGLLEDAADSVPDLPAAYALTRD